MITTSAGRPATDDDVRTPSILVVLVVRDGAPWLRECLQSLASQRYERLGVIAVDNASTDGSHDLLIQALGDRRVLRLDEDRGIAGALSLASELPAAREAEYLLILHDDVALAPDAVVRLVETAEGIHGIERVGVVGPKVVDWDDPRVLREVGRSVDAFGHPYSPLQEDERDQGQYDRVLEVLFVSSCAMLVSREALQRTGRFDERYGGHHDDLDFGWRARVAGFRVLMTPLAKVRHRGASTRGERPESHRRRSSRYFAERSGLASMLKDYGIPTLLWILPLYAIAGLARLFLFALARRFEDAYDLLAAWGWNLLHVFGTIRRRVRVQSVRRVRDREVRRFMASTFRLPRWFERAEELLDEQLEEAAEEGPRLRERATSIALAHPVVVTSILAVGLGALAVRHFVGPEVLQGGALALFPGEPSGFWAELLSGTRTTVLGGVQSASPALGALGGLSWLTFGSTTLAQKVLLAALPPLAGASMYRALSRQTKQPAAATLGAVVYALSAVVLWAFSQGRIPLLVMLAAFPVVWDRFDGSFGGRAPERTGRAVMNLGIALALGAAFLPAVVLAIIPILFVLVLTGKHRGRGAILSVLGIAAGAALVFPLLPGLFDAPAPGLSSTIGTSDLWSILRTAPGDGAGTWLPAAFLPVAAILCFAIVGKQFRGLAWRALIVSVAGLVLAWASVARWLPDAFTNQPTYLGLAALGMAALVGYGAATLRQAIGRDAFGLRQILGAVLTVVLAIGIGSQALQAALAEWDVRPNALPPAWPVVSASAPGPFRIVWFGRVGGDRFPAPGGDPVRILEAGSASIRYGMTDRNGASALDTGRAMAGPGYDFLEEVLQELVSGDTRHGGELLAPLGVRFLVADEGDLPGPVLARLEEQIDLYRVPAGGLTIYRNPRALPVASVVDDPAFARAAATADLTALAALPDVDTEPIRRVEGGWEGETGPGTAHIGTQFGQGWRAVAGGNRADPTESFGWAVGFPTDGGAVTVTYSRQWVRTTEMVILGLLWAVALWITRKQVSQ